MDLPRHAEWRTTKPTIPHSPRSYQGISPFVKNHSFEAYILASSVVQSDYRSGRDATSPPSEERQPGFSGFACVLVARVRATPFSSHPPPARWLSREMPALGHSDRSNDHPQHRREHEVVSNEGHACRRRQENDERAGRKARVHEHRYEKALGTVVDPHHMHPVGR